MGTGFSETTSQLVFRGGEESESIKLYQQIDLLKINGNAECSYAIPRC